jgi:hypothetical protein
MSLPSIGYNDNRPNPRGYQIITAEKKNILKAKRNKINQARYIIIPEYNISTSINITIARPSGGTSKEIGYSTIR